MKYIQCGYKTSNINDAYDLMFNKKGKIDFIDIPMARALLNLNKTLYITDSITHGRWIYTMGKICMGLEVSEKYKISFKDLPTRFKPKDNKFDLIDYYGKVYSKEIEEYYDLLEAESDEVKKEKTEGEVK